MDRNFEWAGDLLAHIEDDLTIGAFTVSEQIDNQHAVGLIEDYLEGAKGKGHSWSDKAISLIYRIGETNLYTVYLYGLSAALVFEVDLDSDRAQFAIED